MKKSKLAVKYMKLAREIDLLEYGLQKKMEETVEIARRHKNILKDTQKMYHNILKNLKIDTL